MSGRFAILQGEKGVVHSNFLTTPSFCKPPTQLQPKVFLPCFYVETSSKPPLQKMQWCTTNPRQCN